MFWKERKKSKIETTSCRHINKSRECIMARVNVIGRQLKLKCTPMIWRGLSVGARRGWGRMISPTGIGVCPLAEKPQGPPDDLR